MLVWIKGNGLILTVWSWYLGNTGAGLLGEVETERNAILSIALSSSLHTKITFHRVLNEVYYWTLVGSKCSSNLS